MMHIKTYHEVMDIVYYFSALTLTYFIKAMKHTRTLKHMILRHVKYIMNHFGLFLSALYS